MAALTTRLHAPGKVLDVLDALGWLHPQDGLDFVWVRPYTVMADYIAEQYTRWDTEYALLRIQLPLKSIKGLESLVEVVDQARGHFGLHYNIVNI
jgi:hypothetical protein